MNRLLLLLCLCPFTLVASTARAQNLNQNWHQWRGPLATGVAPQGKPPTQWSETENVKWKVPVEGRGRSTPIIWQDQVFLLTAVDTEVADPSLPAPEDQPKTNFFNIKRPNTQFEFVVLCLDRTTGKEIWRRTATTKIPHEGTHNDNDYASASPTTDGKFLYCWFGSAGLYCYDLAGNLQWQRDLGEVKVGSSLGEGCSPVLHDGRLVIVRDHAGQSTIEVLDAATGKTLWKKKRDEDNAWATPLVVDHSGKTQVITAASKAVRSYDLSTGEVIWQCSGLTGNVIPCPVIQDNHVICMSGYQGYSAIALPLDQTGDLSERDLLRWQQDRGTPYIPSPVLYQGLLFYNQSNQSIIRILDAQSGELRYGPERFGKLGNVYSSPVAAGGHVYFTGRSGTTEVISSSPPFAVTATNQVSDRVDASPAIAGNQLFLRGNRFLYCLESPGAAN